ncbi:mechanosensitive ion channel family protein [Geobacter sp. DSM 9736]|uniref:mechanosensitive ion channel family protein n=1 Tax=Geobacter sp. DSM 9736 TaxID=1277350 RepID=UPI000B500BA1|nr:mechanosensitive ion channel domain-containing protein [Geobacter sp. DSM 9736]SNB45586.1 Mechanosensitive ion channel [Geobacter sp. DSM 9736]
MDSFIELYRVQPGDNLYLFWLKELLVATLILSAFWIAARVLRRVAATWGGRLTSFTSTDLDDRILQRVIPPASLLVILAGLHYSLRSLPLPVGLLKIASGTIFVAAMVILTNVAYRAADETLKWYSGRLSEAESGDVTRQVIPLVEKLISIFLVGTALIITLKHFNYDILSLVTALGIGSLAIGMAAKDTLANMISGFTIMLDRPFRIGDRIKPGSDLIGDVVDIGLRSTKLKTLDNTYLIIPNSTLCNSNVLNLSLPNVRGTGRVNVGVAYGTDVEKVKSLLVEAAMELPEVLHDPAPAAFLTAFGDNALQMALTFWAEDQTKVFSITDMINTKILNRFRDEGIVIPYPTRTVIIEKEL